MDWERFKEDPYWIKIVEMLNDRANIVLTDIAQTEHTPTLLSLRVLQQEIKDIQFFIAIPDLFIQTPDKELAGVVATDN